MANREARLLSLCPHPLQAAFTIPPSRFPDRAQRSRLFFDALQSLVTWWSQSFFDISDSTLGLRTRPWDEVQDIIDKLPRLSKADFVATVFTKDRKDRVQSQEKLAREVGGERLRSVNSLMKKALQQEGSRDVSSVLFVSLARACGLGARLVHSIQAVPWRAEKVAQKRKSGAGRKARLLAHRQGVGDPSDESSEDEEMEEVPMPEEKEGGPIHVARKMKGKGIRGAGKRRLQDPADVYRLRKQRPAPKTIGDAKPKVKTKSGGLCRSLSLDK